MFYDLNVPWTTNIELEKTLKLLAELDYNVVALNYTISGKLPANITSPIPSPLPFFVPTKLRLLHRCTLILSDPSQNHRLSTLAAAFSLLALRPTNEKALLTACQSLECDVISLDLSVRYPFHFKHTTLSLALARGIKFEICYAAGVLNADGGMSRRNLISNATSLIRATRGRGIILSSEAHKALACRGPWDVVNLAAVWGLGQERGQEGVGREARSVVVQAEMKRVGFRGVVNFVYGGEKPERGVDGDGKGNTSNMPLLGKGKRKVDAMQGGNAETVENEKPISKRELKRRAKKARQEAVAPANDIEVP